LSLPMDCCFLVHALHFIAAQAALPFQGRDRVLFKHIRFNASSSSFFFFFFCAFVLNVSTCIRSVPIRTISLFISITHFNIVCKVSCALHFASTRP